jgi:hypothetical protein
MLEMQLAVPSPKSILKIHCDLGSESLRPQNRHQLVKNFLTVAFVADIIDKAKLLIASLENILLWVTACCFGFKTN